MSTNSAIEWTDCTWNPVVGCTRVSAGCDNCYAVRQTHRLEAMHQPKYAGLTVVNPRGDRHFNGTVRCVDEALEIPLHWKKPRKVFVNSMSDLFHKDVPFDFIDRVFAVMNATQTQLPLPQDVRKAKPWHTYQVLTKRPDRAAEYLESRSTKRWPRTGSHPLFKVRDAFRGAGPDIVNASGCLLWPLPNVWLGTSCEDQATADERIPHLLQCPAAVRMLSLEPLLGPIVLDAFIGGEYATPYGSEPHYNAGLDWVIVGGESGPNARSCNVDWVRSIIKQCKAAGVPCFVKQLGRYAILDKRFERAPFPATRKLADPKGGDMDEWPEDLRVREFPK